MAGHEEALGQAKNNSQRSSSIRRTLLASQSEQGRVPSLFSSVEEYADFMEAPTRVLSLEWRRVKRSGHGKLISHSFLQARLLDGRQYRFEKTQDQGLVSSSFSAGEIIFDNGDIYLNRTAMSHEFVRPILLSELQCVAIAIGGQPYSLRSGNCHHFVRDMWNSLVIQALQCQHYPDRAKSGLLVGVSAPFVAFGLEHISSSFSSSSRSVGRQRTMTSADNLDLRDKVRLLVQSQTDPGEVVGEFSAVIRDSAFYGKEQRQMSFSQALSAAQVYRLLRASDLLPWEAPPPNTKDPCGTWLVDQMPCGLGDAGLRIVERISCVDVQELAAQLAVAFSNNGGYSCDLECMPRRGKRGSFRGRLASTFCCKEEDPILDIVWVYLESEEEIRVATYARLKPLAKGKPERTLRMLSGDALRGEEHLYAFTIREPVEAKPASAIDALEQELESLRIAHATSDWRFLTLL
mmetsp:Transcript_62351/g.115728  ORF Transcript_62351/g.115728 Transcript_62351/m.115728 type:complete len:463 (-) Transcript_62351:76-1464(-)